MKLGDCPRCGAGSMWLWDCEWRDPDGGEWVCLRCGQRLTARKRPDEIPQHAHDRTFVAV